MDVDAGLIAAVRTAAQKLSGAGDFSDLLREVLAISVDAVGAGGGTVYLHDPARSRLTFQHVLPARIEPLLRMKDVADDFGTVGAAFQERRTIAREFPPKAKSERSAFEKATGVEVFSILAVPLALADEAPIGVMQLLNKAGGAFTANDAAVVETIAAVATMAQVNRQLTQESARASTLLGMGKVSHDIGNLAASLHATIHYSEMALDGLRAHLLDRDMDAATEGYLFAQRGTFGDLKESVDRIVGYSRLISDMSAGKALRPNRRKGPLAPVVENAASYLETDARAKGVDLRYELDEEAPHYHHDDLYIFRIVQNLVGNAIKAVTELVREESGTANRRGAETPNGTDEGRSPSIGEVVVRYRYEIPSGRQTGEHSIEVSDTGPGMSEETARRILSGEITSRWERASGSGWGLRIVTELAGSHSGRLEIESEIGRGSVFRVRFPEEEAARTQSEKGASEVLSAEPVGMARR